MSWNSKPVVLTVAVTGADVFRENNPNIPYTTAERILDDEGQVVVEAEFGLVLWDPQRRGSRPITDEERASLEEVST